MWEKFTKRAKQVISEAREVAVRMGSDHVQTEHLLIALCRGPKGIAVRVLEALGADVEALAAQIERQMPPGSFKAAANRDEIVFTPRARTVFQMSVEEARRFDHNHIGTEHLLLGLLKEGGSVAARTLRDMKIDLDRVEAEMERPSHPVATMATREDFALTTTVKEALELALAEVVKEKESAIGSGEHEKAAWWRAKERVLLSLLDEP